MKRTDIENELQNIKNELHDIRARMDERDRLLSQPRPKRKLAPPGWYDAWIEEVDLRKASITGRQYWHFTLRFVHGKAFYTLVERPRTPTSDLCNAFGLNTGVESARLTYTGSNPTELINCACRILIAHDEYAGTKVNVVRKLEPPR